jgi:putative transposase
VAEVGGVSSVMEGHPGGHAVEKDTVVTLPRPGAMIADDLPLSVLYAGARRMPMQAIKAEVEAFLSAQAGRVDEQGCCWLVRNGHAPARRIQTGIGPIEVARPKLRDRGAPGAGRIRITSAVLPAYLRRTKNIEEVLPWLYLKGVLTGQFTGICCVERRPVSG